MHACITTAVNDIDVLMIDILIMALRLPEQLADIQECTPSLHYKK